MNEEIDDLELEGDSLLDQVNQLKAELQSLKAQNAAMRSALEKAAHELNVIRARDGVPWTHYGKSDVCPNYFSSVVDECQAALSTNPPSSYVPAAQVAVLREALEKCYTLGEEAYVKRHPWLALSNLIDFVRQALATTQPSSPRSLGATYHGPYVSREAVLPVAQVLRSALIFMEDYLDGHNHSGVSRIVSDGREALATARQLGLLEDKQ